MRLPPRSPTLLIVALGAAGACSVDVDVGPAGATRSGVDAGADGTVAVADAGIESFHVPLQRLTRAELDRALSLWLRDPSKPASRLLAEEPFTPFDRDHATQAPSTALVDSLQALAEDVAARLLADPQRFEQVVGCPPDADAPRACFDAFVESQGELMLRRPLQDEEQETYATMWELAGQAPDSLGPRLGVAVSLLVETWLQDPEVLYRLEHGGGEAAKAPPRIELSDHEVATRLAFWMWGLPPDRPLLEAANTGELRSAAGRRVQAERLLADGRAREHWRRYHAMWLGYRAIPHPASLVRDFQQETEALIDRVLFEQRRDYFDLFRLEETYVSPDLAAHYGLKAPEDGAGWVLYPESSGRRGLLAHGSVLSAFSKFSDTSPTQRGILVRERLMCWPVAPPPPVVDVDQPPEAAEEGACKEDRYRAHADNTGCAACHNQIDPIGFGLERFDMAGRTRETDLSNPSCEIEGVGTLPMHGEFSGPGELSELLLDTGELTDCAPRFMLQYLWGRELTDRDEAQVVALSERFAAVDHRFVDWLLSLVEDPRFTQRALEVP